jgi:hypothetical protein
MARRLLCPDSGKRMTANIHTITACCPACGQWVRLRKDGCLMNHKPLMNNNERLKQTADAIRDWKAGKRES